VWSQTVEVTSGSYNFSVWVASCHGASPAQLQFLINGISVGTFTASSTTGLWQEFTTTWNSNSNWATIQVVDLNTAAYGNDFALDDLSFTSTGSVQRFLDLPFSYSNFSQAAQGNVNGNGGRVNSWFDHSYPTYSNPPNANTNNITKWQGPPIPINPNMSDEEFKKGIGVWWYDGHNGIDFQSLSGSNTVYAAAPGIIKEVHRNWSQTNCGVRGCPYGNYVLIDHGNGYATFYAHLASVSSQINTGTSITDPKTTPLGIMGGTGGWETHLHFGLYYDNGGQWVPVDPFGWDVSKGADPWSVQTGVQSIYLWKYPLSTQQTGGTSGTTIASPSTNAQTVIPAGALTTTVTLELWDTTPVAAPSAQLRSAARAFWLRVLEWLFGGQSAMRRTKAATSSFAQPVTVQVTYGITETQHLDISQLTLLRWDDTTSAWIALPTTVDTNLKTATAQTTGIGNFDLQAPLLCPADSQEIDDNYYVAKTITIDGVPASRLFDIAQDEDWLKLNAVAGQRYLIQTGNLASGVDTVLQVYDLDGVTQLALDDNSGGGKASRLLWQAPQTGTYFVRVSQAAGSAFGCSATYQVSVTQQSWNFLPFIRR